MTNTRHAHLLGLTSVAVAAYGVSVGKELRPALIMAALLAAAAVATLLYERRPARPAPAGAPVKAQGGLLQTKRMLMLLMAIGIVVYGGGAGTFSSFSAETSNTNSTIASGTLTMSDTVNGSTATACASATSITQENTNELPSGQTLNTGSGQTTPTSGNGGLGACDIALSLSNLAPGVFAGYSKIDIKNTGSLNASKFWLFAPYVNTAFNPTNGVTLAQGAVITNPLPVLPLEGPIKSGDQIELDYGGQQQIVTAAANVGPLKTAIPLTGSPTASFAMPTGTRVLDDSTDGKVNTVPQNTDCFDVRNSTPGIANATAGTDLNFNKTSLGEQDVNTHWVIDSTNTYTGPLCSKMGFWIQEQSVVNGNTYNYCWYGDGASNTAHPTTNGMCRAPVSAAFSASQAIAGGNSYSITPAATLKGNIGSGDTIAISELSKPTAYCTATADEYMGAQTIPINNCVTTAGGSTSFTSTTFSTAATITDYTTLTDLNTDTQTLSNFDTLDGPNNKQELVSLVGNGKLATTGATVTSVELGQKGAAGSADGVNFIGSSPDTRTFYMGVFLPSGTAQNALQGLKSTFGIGWHIDQ